MGRWRQTGVERVTVTLYGVDAEGSEATGRVAGFRGHVRGARVTFTPEIAIVKAERALTLLLEPPGPRAPSADAPGWLHSWASLRSSSDPTTARLQIVVEGETCTDTSVFDPTLTHRLLFVCRADRRPTGHPHRRGP